ncbi:MAG: hypothetical protein GHCLOJNM_00363 [bacterium]|nr:hypothetical protein [bacterium]
MTHRISRRECLKTLAVSSAALPASAPWPALAGGPPGSSSGYIDGHVHVWSSDTIRYPLAPDQRKEQMRPASFTPEDFFTHAGRCGVTRANLIQMSYYGFDNSYMLDMIAAHPGAFVGTAIVDPFGPDLEGEMTRLAARGCPAFRIQPAHSKQPPESWLRPEPMERMFAIAAKHRLILSTLIRWDALPELERVCGKHPDTQVIIDHLCLLATGDTQPPTEEHMNRLAVMAKHPRVFLKVGAFYALGERTPPYLDLLPLIRRMVEAFTPSRCLWESDCPFQVTNHSYEDSIALIRDHADFLSASDKDRILRGTAESLFFQR